MEKNQDAKIVLGKCKQEGELQSGVVHSSIVWKKGTHAFAGAHKGVEVAAVPLRVAAVQQPLLPQGF